MELSETIRNIGSDIGDEVEQLEKALYSEKKSKQEIIKRLEFISKDMDKATFEYKALRVIIEQHKEAI